MLENPKITPDNPKKKCLTIPKNMCDNSKKKGLIGTNNGMEINGKKWQDIARNRKKKMARNVKKWQEMARNSKKLQETARNSKKR